MKKSRVHKYTVERWLAVLEFWEIKSRERVGGVLKYTGAAARYYTAQKFYMSPNSIPSTLTKAKHYRDNRDDYELI